MYSIRAFYQFTGFEEPHALRPPLRALCTEYDVIGTILLAREGINGTIAAPTQAGVSKVIAHIKTFPGCAEMEEKASFSENPPFKRLRIRLKREIVTMQGETPQPDMMQTGQYVAPQDWNALSQQEDVVLIDTRNDYEIAIGSFANAINPKIKRFGDFPRWWQENKARFHGKKIAMFCTGGIRCEKSTNYLLSEGVEGVYHLRGGILKYLEDIPPDDSTWQGECYVFDERVSVCGGVKEGTYKMCHACGRPLSPEDLKHEKHDPGVQCHRCEAEYTPEDRARFRERQRQLERTKTRKP